MTGQLFINTKDAFTTWGAVMQSGCFEELLKPAPSKPFPENESRATDGKEVVALNPRKAAREVTLKISISGTSRADYLTKYRAFFTEIAAGISVFKVPVLGESYRLVYKDVQQMKYGATPSFSSFNIQFEEINPANRAN